MTELVFKVTEAINYGDFCFLDTHNMTLRMAQNSQEYHIICEYPMVVGDTFTVHIWDRADRLIKSVFEGSNNG